MIFVCVGFVIISILMAARLFSLHWSIRNACKQMDEMEEMQGTNRQLKALRMDRTMERLFYRINQMYNKRQEEHIVYLRREEQIRREVENISHDLRTPLTSIIGYVDLIKDQDTEDMEKEEYLEIIGRRARVLQGFIQDFYELSRIEGNDYPLLHERVEISSIIKEVVVAYYQDFAKRNIQVDINIMEEPINIIGDRIQFNRIINNLVQNALKYAEKSFGVNLYSQNGECVIELLNDKNQLKEKDLVYIFDRFYTGDITRNSQSTGLGLSIAKVLIEKLKGNVEAKIVGELFIITLRWKLS